jgi:hypothetical protein
VEPDALDFWLGEWDCTWEGGSGRNRITRELDGAVVVERFEAFASEAFTGTSLSVFDAHLGTWRQTWADSDANYWAFVGSAADGEVTFATPTRVDRDDVFKRMVFSDIEPERFRWRWESSPDGQRWTERWAIGYRRRG